MNKKNTEEWIQWRPLSNLRNKYYIELLSDDTNGLKIILCTDNLEDQKILINFENSVDAYTRTDDSFVGERIKYLYDNYGKDFYTKCSFFQILNSDYIKRISKESGGISDTRSLKHYVFLG